MCVLCVMLCCAQLTHAFDERVLGEKAALLTDVGEGAMADNMWRHLAGTRRLTAMKREVSIRGLGRCRRCGYGRPGVGCCVAHGGTTS